MADTGDNTGNTSMEDCNIRPCKRKRTSCDTFDGVKGHITCDIQDANRSQGICDNPDGVDSVQDSNTCDISSQDVQESGDASRMPKEIKLSEGYGCVRHAETGELVLNDISYGELALKDISYGELALKDISSEELALKDISSSSSVTKQVVCDNEIQTDVTNKPHVEQPSLVGTKRNICVKDDVVSSASCSNADIHISQQLSVNLSNSSPDTDMIYAIHKLPPHVLVHVFHYLSIRELLCRVSLVSKMWYQLAHDPELWRNIDLRYFDRVTDSVLLTLTSYSDRVSSLDLSNAKDITCSGIMDVMKQCKHLQTLKLYGYFALTDGVVQVIGESCHKLQHLNLEICFRITDNAVKMIAEGCPELTELHLSQCKNVTDDGVMEIAKHCHLLKQLMLGSCGGITDKSVIELTKGCPMLECLQLTHSNLTDDSVREFKHLKNLRVLDISSIPGITKAAILPVIQHCVLLQSINLSLNPLVDDNCVEIIAKYGHNLKELYCVSCKLTDTGLEKIGEHSQTIEQLDVGWCRNITDEGVRTLSTTCPSLRHLGLIRCDNVTIETMEELVQCYPHINYSTFILSCRRLIEQARQQGFQFDSDNEGPSLMDLTRQ